MIEAWFSASENHRVLGAEQGLEQPAIGVETGGEEDRVVRAEERGQPRFQRAVQVLRAADEAHARHAVAVAVHRLLRGGDERGVIGKPEIVVGAEVQHVAAIGRDRDMSALGRDDGALGLPQSVPTGWCRASRIRGSGTLGTLRLSLLSGTV